MKARREREFATSSRCTLDFDGSSHQGYQPRCYREPKTCASVFARRRHVLLLESAEYRGLLVDRNADSRIAHREFQLDVPVGSRSNVDLDRNFTVQCKLDGVAHQV